MSDRSTTVSTVTAAIVVGAVLCGAMPAQAVTPTPSASAAPTASATTTPPPTPTASATTPLATASATPTPTASRTPTPVPTASRTATPTPVASTTPTPVATSTPSATPAPTPTQTPLVPPPVGTRLSHGGGHAALSRTITLTGSRLQDLRTVLVAGRPTTDLVVVSPTKARFTMPISYDYQARVAPISLVSVDGTTWPTPLTFSYKVVSGLDRQMAYAFQNWNSYSNATFGYLAGSDCANFASQTLLARGWTRTPQWFNYGVGRWSATWVSSTALSRWLKKRPDLVTWRPYRQRDLVKVGDIVQFRWPGHKKGYTSWDHTGIVSKVVVLPDGRHDVYYTSHTLNRQFGGSTQLLAKVMAKDLRIQFFSVK